MDSADLNAKLGPPPPTPLSYGTAGFRGPADTIHEAVLRCGALAAARSRAVDGRAVGLMLTASHNPEPHNGVKLVDFDGRALPPAWEALAARVVNARDPAAVLASAAPAAGPAAVLLAWDTRPSAPALRERARRGAAALRAAVEELGLATTPQLHFSLRARARGAEAGLDAYAARLRAAYAALVGDARPPVAALAVDCACGVGASALPDVLRDLPCRVAVVNRPGDGPLNERCGADFVQKARAPPVVHAGAAPTAELWASLDGDADRLVMFAPEGEGITLADGDRFAVLVAAFVSRHLAAAAVPALSVAVAQTAYSNGAATAFLALLPGVEVVVARTGVKHLERALSSFDVGIYWEPNGHGTVLFADAGLAALSAARDALGDEPERRTSLDTLLALAELANQAVGDGVADLLLALGILARERMSFADWLKLYDERTSFNLVVRVADKAVVATEDCDRLVKEPRALRNAVARIADAAPGCRAFVRPSGTEDVVRVYAEAPVGQEGTAREIAADVARAVYDLCGGVGERP